MNKKTMEIIIGFVIIGILGITAFLLYTNKKEETKPSNDSDIQETENGNDIKEDSSGSSNIGNGKTLVVYFSASNNTKRVAEKIASNLDADLFEIVPEEEYTSEDLNWSNSNSRVSREHNDKSLRNIKLKSISVANWESYETVILGYPIWWGIAAWPVETFVKNNDFSGKTVIPFCTSASSGLGESGVLLAAETKGGNWLDGKRFSSGASDSEIQAFTNSLK